MRIVLLIGALLGASTAAAQDAGARAPQTTARPAANPKELYLQGCMLKDTSPAQAAGLFREVVRLTPASDELHQKAAARLRELKP